MQATFDQTQTVAPPDAATTPRGVLSLQLSLEMILYLSLFGLALALRVVALNHVPLDDVQAHEALAALHRVDPNLAGQPVIAKSPLMAFANQFAFIFLDHSNFSARIATAMAGACLVWGPFLWRRFLGKVSALSMALLLAVSPVALTAARTLGAVTWTMGLVFIAVWLVARYLENPDRRFALSITMVFGSMSLLTEPTGIVTALGLLAGLLLALWMSRDNLDTPTPLMMLTRALREWPWAEGLMATVALVIVVGTGFLTSIDGLTSVGTTLYDFLRGLVERPADNPRAFALLTALRYDFGLVIFGIIGLYFALTEGDFFSRFLAGWLAWSLLAGLLYPGATADAGLWISVPAAGLTALLVARMLRSASSGYWYVPWWAIPVHAAATAVFLVALVINSVTLSQALQRESRPVYSHFLPTLTSAARVGTFDQRSAVNTFQVSPAQPATIVIQLVKLDDGIKPTLRVESERDGLIYGPYAYKEGRRGLVVQVDLPSVQTYTIRVIQAEGEPYGRGQYVLLTYPANVEEAGIWGTGLWKGYRLDIPMFWTFTRLVSNQTHVFRIMVMVFVLMLITILYFLAGSLWGSRAAWRGLGFGFLVYFTVYGLGLGWQASMTFANDARELWYTSPPTTRIHRLVETLEQMSRFDNGTRHEMRITVQGQNDGALAWALREFTHVEYVNALGNGINTAAVIAPATRARPPLGADYVGQDFLLAQQWHVSDLNWLDFFAWLTLRDTRFDPSPRQSVMLWIRQDVYGVQQVPTP